MTETFNCTSLVNGPCYFSTTFPEKGRDFVFMVSSFIIWLMINIDRIMIVLKAAQEDQPTQYHLLRVSFPENAAPLSQNARVHQLPETELE